MKLVNVEDLKVLVAVESKGEIRYGKLVTDLFDDIPTVEAIPIVLYEQVKGERDVAVEQLKSLNVELFEKPYLKAITIEFLEKWFGDNYNALTDLEIAWEKENEKG